MKRHPFNILSLVFGVILVLIAAGAAWITFPAPRWVLDFSDWLLPGAAIVIGAALLSPLFTAKHPEKTSGDDTDSRTTDGPTDHP